MNIDKQYKGRVRIEGKPDDMHGYQLSVKDADTGEEISNVKSVVLRMGVGTGDEGVNRATLTYYKHDEHGLFVINERRKVAMETVTVSDPEIAVTAYEVEGTTQYRHEQVRKFVESEYPGYRVLSIQERANSLFETPLHGLAVPPPDRVLTRCDVEFEVVADSDPLGIPLPRIQEHHLIVNVSTSADGSLCIGRETRIRTAPERILDV